ncbi:MAG: hypothetical protein V3S00_04205 [Dehalococcoidia bacterium]
MGKRKRSGSGGTDQEVPQGRRLLRVPQRLAFIAIAVVLLAGIGSAALLVSGRGGEGSPAGPKTAVILNQLSLTQPNPEFVSAARSLLAEAGYQVDYFPGEQVTVDLYRSLPQRDYDLIILRVHAGITTEVDLTSGERSETEYVSLFTGEPYAADKYPEEQLNRLGKAVYYEGADPLFGIGPRFVEESMEGTFGGALIVMMGCDGLRSQRTAQAFLDKGASAFVSWSQPVSASHTDAATERLLEKLLREGLDASEAVDRTASEIGPDPFYDAELRILTGGG